MNPHSIRVFVTRQKHLAIVQTQEDGQWVVTMCAAAASALRGKLLPPGEVVKGRLYFVEDESQQPQPPE